MNQINPNEIPSLVKKKRKSMGFTQKEFSEFLSLNGSGERTVRGWENGEHLPSNKRLEEILSMNGKAPFKRNSKPVAFKFIDLFAGIGGTRIPFQELGGECVFTSEWDKFSKKTYAANYGELPYGDITKISNSDIPDHDVLLAGFPCQAFSQAGLKQGFQDTRGTLFFEIQRILAAKRPKAFLLENVKQLKGHNKGQTLDTILKILRGENAGRVPENIEISDEAKASLGEKLGYYVDFRVLKASDFGVPQNRERIYIVGFDKKAFPNINLDQSFAWPEPSGQETRLGNILEDNCRIDPKYTISDRLWAGHQRRKAEHKEKGNGFGYSLFTPDDFYSNTISARYYKDGSEILIDQSDIGANPRKLTPRECARLQGFPEEFIVDAVSDVQAYKQFGNSVAVPVIRQIAMAMTRVWTQ
jgi:DNA (cytosine-5)-methyltransferase 1